MMNGTISEKKKKTTIFLAYSYYYSLNHLCFGRTKLPQGLLKGEQKKRAKPKLVASETCIFPASNSEDMDLCKHGAIYISLRSISCTTPRSVSFAVQILMAAFLLEHVQNEGAQSQMMSSLTIPHSPGTPASLPMLPWLLHSPEEWTTLVPFCTFL